jgi:Helix-destabilising protein.
MIRVLVKSENVSLRNGTGKNGKAYSFREQHAALDDGGDFPAPFRLRLEREQPAYKPGLYTFDPKSYRVGQYGDVELRFVSLVPLDAKPQAAKAA